jgi:hypothetical protein
LLCAVPKSRPGGPSGEPEFNQDLIASYGWSNVISLLALHADKVERVEQKKEGQIIN